MRGIATARLRPRIPNAEVYHFTSAYAAESIEQSKTFRLYNLEKRNGEGEIEAFCQAHSLDGYLEQDQNGVPYYQRALMPQMFYASFASAYIDDDTERNLWSSFAKNGARMKFRVTAQNSNFRRVHYPGPGAPQPIRLLRDLAELAKDKYNRRFVLRGMSRICAFYLPSEYSIEAEQRMLFKKWPDFGPEVLDDGTWKYVEIPLGADNKSGYTIELLEIQSDAKLNLTDPNLLVSRS